MARSKVNLKTKWQLQLAYKFRHITLIIQLVCDAIEKSFAEQPKHVLRFWNFVLPYLWYYNRSAYSFEIESYFIKAWIVAKRGHLGYTAMPLPVLNNTVDAPCEGCGGRCCKVPVGTRGFHVVVLQTWEEFYKRERKHCKPSSVPGEIHFHFDKKPDGSRACRFLQADGKCGVYAYRPLACRNFSCTNGLIDKDPHCSATFLDSAPEVKERLLDLGFKEIKWVTK